MVQDSTPQTSSKTSKVVGDASFDEPALWTLFVKPPGLATCAWLYLTGCRLHHPPITFILYPFDGAEDHVNHHAPASICLPAALNGPHPPKAVVEEEEEEGELGRGART